MTAQLAFRLSEGCHWMPTRDGDPTVREIFDRHYSRQRYADGRTPKLFVGPGEKMVLRTPDADAIWVWRKYIDDAQPPQTGVNCAVFRNEGANLSSDLIRAAMGLGAQRWPGERCYTYVNGGKVASPNPGFCFQAAGWRRCGHTKGGLVILEATL